MRQHWRRCLGLPWHQPRHGAGAESSTPGSLPPHTTLQPPSPCHCQQQQGNLEQGRPCRAQPGATARRRAGHPLGSLRRAAASPQPFPRGLGTGRSSQLNYLLSDCSKATSSRCLNQTCQRNGFWKVRPPDGQNGDTQTVPPQPALAGPGCCPEGLSASVGALVPARGPGQQLGLPGTEQMGRAHEHVRLGPLPLVPWGRSGQEEKLRRLLLLAGGSGA